MLIHRVAFVFIERGGQHLVLEWLMIGSPAVYAIELELTP